MSEQTNRGPSTYPLGHKLRLNEEETPLVNFSGGEDQGVAEAGASPIEAPATAPESAAPVPTSPTELQP